LSCHHFFFEAHTAFVFFYKKATYLHSIYMYHLTQDPEVEYYTASTAFKYSVFAGEEKCNMVHI